MKVVVCSLLLNLIPMSTVVFAESKEEVVQKENPQQNKKLNTSSVSPRTIATFILNGESGLNNFHFVNEPVIFSYDVSAAGAQNPFGNYRWRDNVTMIITQGDTVEIEQKGEGVHYFTVFAEDLVMGDSDNGHLYILKQTTESFLSVEPAINPTLIQLGRVEDDFIGSGAKYEWVIKNSEGTVVMSGTDHEPDMTSVNELPVGDYIVEVTATENYPTEFAHIGSGFVTHQSHGSFKISQGEVITKHMYTDSVTEVAPSEIQTGKPGDSYTSKPLEAGKISEGYKLSDLVEGETEGSFDSSQKVVVYYYEPVDANVVVKHTSSDGKVFDTETFDGKYNENYSTTANEYEGYKLVGIPENAVGQYKVETTTVTYVYEPVATKVTIHFVDEKGKKLATSEEINGHFGEEYNAKPKNIPGYELIKIPSNQSGTHQVSTTDVTYVYSKIAPPIVDDTYEGGKIVTGSGTPNSTVVVTFPNGEKVEVKVDENGEWTVKVPSSVQLKKGDKIYAVTVDSKTGMMSEEAVGNVIARDSGGGSQGGSESGNDTDRPGQPGNPSSGGNTNNTTNGSKDKELAFDLDELKSQKLPKTGSGIYEFGILLGFIFVITSLFVLRRNKKMV